MCVNNLNPFCSPKKGISLIVLVISIIVVIILSTIIILAISKGSLSDKAVKARFMNDFRSVQEGVSLYGVSNIDTSNAAKVNLPVDDKLTLDQKQEIANNNSTLKTKIEELNPGKTINDVNLYWINEDKIGVKLSAQKKDKGYIIDIDTNQIYDYVGDYFENARWHTLDGGVANGEIVTTPSTDEIWNGWIKLTLYYPSDSTERKWILGTEGEVRQDSMLVWQDYTGPIWVPLDRVKDVWIKYKLDNKDVIIPPAGTLLVDIDSDNVEKSNVDKANVIIHYDEEATTKEYKIGNSDWQAYTEPFTVTENCLIEARASKTEKIYNTDGSFLAERKISGRDAVYISNIGGYENIDESLPAPTITRKTARNDDEVASVHVDYPEIAVTKIYKLNYGIEQTYTDDISITKYGTYVIAYYYDVNGKRSKSSAIYINDTTSGTQPQSPEEYTPPTSAPTPSYSYVIEAPTIAVGPLTLTDSVQVSVNSPANADKVYIKLGKYSTYQEYTMPVTVRQNMQVYAYYITYDGEKSDIGYGLVNNIKEPNKPYVYIDADPYPWSWSYGADKVIVTINSSDADTVEYSEDEIVYKPYTGSFDVTKNERVYARATNANGVTETYLDITNIGKLTPPPEIQKLAVSINANPDPAISTDKIDKVKITIEYDSKATEKYYTIGKYGALQNYTGPFDITSNCTIYAYAKATNAQGMTAKKIDNISAGISEPLITAVPENGIQASKVNISIEYDKSATIKRYSINGGSLTDYIQPFDVTENGTVVYAYSQNALGQKSEATYVVENIVPEPPILMLDKGDYYLLKLNYPEGSQNREYKWKENGEWKSYKDAGILLIKPEHKDDVIKNGTLVKIEDENGKMVTYTGDYYFIDVAISEISENIFIRWDRKAESAPQIIPSTTEATKNLTATIIYGNSLITKQYRILESGGTLGDWQDYTGPINITKNNTIIYARGQDEAEVWSKEGMYKVTNIDEIPPTLKLITSDLDTATRTLSVRVAATDDVGVDKIKYASGLQNETYFESNGADVVNNSVIKITENGIYTFYTIDMVGNIQISTLTVTNVDLTPPAIDIQISPDTTAGTEATATIDYGDSTVKQYKIGESNATWTNYTNPVTLSSYTILANNWQNEDGTVTIYAKGKDSAGNEITVQKKIVSLDLDAPQMPVIQSNSGYAILEEYGVTFDTTTTITYDSRNDIDNYYSLNDGDTWLPYTGEFQLQQGTVIAKSVKKNTGLEIIETLNVTMPSDALGLAAYDGDDNTQIVLYTDKDLCMRVDNSLQGKNIRVLWEPRSHTTITLRFLDENKNEISSIAYTDYLKNEKIYTIPDKTKWLTFKGNASNYDYLYEVEPCNEPTFEYTPGYMLLTADPTKAIRNPYAMVTINYFGTSLQKLYKIGDGQWQDYIDQPIWVNQGETIYAKGIDKYGNETRTISMLTVNIQDAIGLAAYDENDNTQIVLYTDKDLCMRVDNSLQGKNIRVLWEPRSHTTITLRFLDENKNEISSIAYTDYLKNEKTYTIPDKTKWLTFKGNASNYDYLYEITPL